MTMIPTLRGSCREMPGTFTLPQELTYEGVVCPQTLELFAARIRRLPGLGRTTLRRAEEGVLLLRKDRALPAEGYRLVISAEGITCEAADGAGFNYALVTLYQMLEEQGPDLACICVEDAPRMSWRGFMLDVSRHFFDAEEVKKLIEQCALLKLNRFHWHLSDDQGYRIESKRFPRLNEISSWREQTLGDGVRHGGYYTQDEIREIVAYAAQRCIEIVPEIDLPGHTSALIAAYPEFSCSGEPMKVAEAYGILPRILCAGKESVYGFLDALLEEVTALFPYEYFHIGGDEAPKSEWEKCPDCGRALAEHGLSDHEALQAHFTGRLVDMLSRRGKTAIAWNEAMASGQLREDVVAHYWIEWGPSYSQREAAKGRKFIFSNMFEFYLDYPAALIPPQAQLTYEPNIQGQPVPEEAVLGIEAPLWSEHVPDNGRLEYMVFPRLASLAQRAWSGATDPEVFLAKLPALLRQWKRAGIQAAPLADVTEHGERAYAQIAEHFTRMFAGVAHKPEEMTPEKQEAMAQRRKGFLGAFMKNYYTPEEIGEAAERLNEMAARGR